MPPVAFVTRRANELHGLRTALVGILCLILAAWNAIRALSDGVGQPVAWALAVALLVLAVADDGVAAYYRRRAGVVGRRHPGRHLFALVALGAVLTAGGIVDATSGTTVKLVSLGIAMIHLHVAIVSGYPYQWHYAVAAGVWLALSLLPFWQFPTDVSRAIWFAGAGSALIGVGWHDHRLLTRALKGETDGHRA